MRTLIVSEFISLDGIVDSPGGGAHPEAGWTFKDVEFDEAAYEIKGREQGEAEAMIMGRVTYQEFAPVWPSMDDVFAKYNQMPKYVVTTTLTDDDVSGWNNTSVLGSLDAVADLKAGEGGPIILAGSPTLAQALAAAGLVDRYILLEFPLVLGSGKRLFAADGGSKQKLSLVEQAAYSNGIRLAVYDVVH